MRKLLFCILIAGYTGLNVIGQDSSTGKKKWDFLIEPYLMFPNMNGSIGVGNLPDVKVVAIPGDILSKLQIGYMLFAEVSNDKWAVNSDMIYANLTMDVKTGTLINSGEATAKQFEWELSGLRRVSPWLEIGVGGLLNSVYSGIVINVNNLGEGTTDNAKELTKTWFDPMLIARIKSKRGEKFVYQFRGEIGGFGIGSTLAYQLQADAGYQFSKLFRITVGYRLIGLDYEKGSGEERFLYDVDMFGPELKFGFNF
jgi:hypothetical protein